MTSIDYRTLSDKLLPAFIDAGRLMLEHRKLGVKVERKGDGSPVTRADQEAEIILLSAVRAALPGVRILSEEAESTTTSASVDPAGLIVMVDPLDGTREYIAGGNDFTVNIGISSDGIPAFGMVLQPTSGRLFVTTGPRSAIEVDASPALLAGIASSTRLASPPTRAITTRTPNPKALVALSSRSHDSPEAKRFLSTLSIAHTERLGSSLKFCLLACGEADIYPRFGPTHVWDTCAGHAIVRSAGGVVTTDAGMELRYTSLTPPFLNPSFIGWGTQELRDQVMTT